MVEKWEIIDFQVKYGSFVKRASLIFLRVGDFLEDERFRHLFEEDFFKCPEYLGSLISRRVGALPDIYSGKETRPRPPTVVPFFDLMT